VQDQVGLHALQQTGDRPLGLASGAAVPDDGEGEAGVGLLGAVRKEAVFCAPATR
jgi:hypothetical protein